MNISFQNLIEHLQQYQHKGKHILPNGTQAICHVPHVAPEAWLHIIYPGLTERQIRELEDQLPIPLPDDYKEFLLHVNGINIYSDSLSIWGLKTSYDRNGDQAFQPYDLLALNEERPIACPDSWLYFGSYSWDGSRVFFDLSEGSENNKVYYCDRDSTNILKEWSSFWTWIDEEVERLSKLFDKDGVQLDEDIPTSPVSFVD